MVPLASIDGLPLTVAHVLPWPAVGGSEVATLRLIAAVAGRYRQVAFCLHGADELASRCQAAGAELALYTPPVPSLRHFDRFRADSQQLAGQFRARGVHLVHCAEMLAAYHCSYAARLAGVPVISHVRSRYPQISLRTRLALWSVAHFVFVSNDARRGFGVQLPAGKAEVLYDGVALPAEPPAPAGLRVEFGLPAETPLVGMIARVNPVKDFRTLVDAAQIVLRERPDVRFVVAGDNALVDMNRAHHAEVVGWLRAAGIESSFLFTGHRVDVPALIEDFNIVVLPTHREGLPLSILEAMAQAKPVVATRVGGLPELIDDGHTGLLHAHADAGELAAMILRCLNDPAWARELGRNAQATVRERFDADGFARAATKLYDRWLPAPQPHPAEQAGNKAAA